MLMRLLSPAVFMGLLAALVALQLVVRWGINRRMEGRRVGGDEDGGEHGGEDVGGVGGSVARVDHQHLDRMVKTYRLLLPAVPAVVKRDVRAVQEPAEAGSSPSASVAWAPATPRRKSAPFFPSQKDLQQPLMLSSTSPGEDVDGAASDPPPPPPPTGDSVRGVLVFHLRTLVRLCLFSYNAVTLVSLACFHTRDVREFGARLWQYPTIGTGDPSYAALAVLFTVVLVCVVLGGPVALMAYLVRCRRLDIIGPGQNSSVRTAADLPASAPVSQTGGCAADRLLPPHLLVVSGAGVAASTVSDSAADLRHSRGVLVVYGAQQRIPHHPPAGLALPPLEGQRAGAADTQRTGHADGHPQCVQHSVGEAGLDQCVAVAHLRGAPHHPASRWPRGAGSSAGGRSWRCGRGEAAEGEHRADQRE